jgi:hypothetical protein
MATMTLPIRELELSVCVGVEKARAETECVAFYSQYRTTSFSMALKLGLTTAFLKWLLSRIARKQGQLISAYQSTDFTVLRNDEIARMAKCLEDIVDKGRPVLGRLTTFGPRAQTVWGHKVTQLSGQLDYLESIAQSLRMECDAEVSTLLAAAIEKMAATEAAQQHLATC